MWEQSLVSILKNMNCRRHQVSRRLYFSLREAEVNFWSPSGAVSWVNWTVFLLLKIFLCGSESPLMRIPWSGSGNWAFNLMAQIYKRTLNHVRIKNNLICFARSCVNFSATFESQFHVQKGHWSNWPCQESLANLESWSWAWPIWKPSFRWTEKPAARRRWKIVIRRTFYSTRLSDWNLKIILCCYYYLLFVLVCAFFPALWSYEVFDCVLLNLKLQQHFKNDKIREFYLLETYCTSKLYVEI